MRAITFSRTEGFVDVPSLTDRRLRAGRAVLRFGRIAPSGFGRVAATLAPRATAHRWGQRIPSLFQLRPSVRRTVASCLLYGVYPLLALAPTEEYLDVDADDYARCQSRLCQSPYFQAKAPVSF